MKVVSLKKTKLDQVVKVLKSGGLVIYPTETCYGLAADATNAQAVQKLLVYKGSRTNKPISVAVADQEMAEKYVRLNATAKNLYQNFLPGPLTVVSQSKGKVTANLEADDHTLGIRIPAYPFVLKLIAQFGKPITATSANTSGKKQPYSFADWQRYTSQKKQKMINFFLDAGPLSKKQPSTVVNTILNEPTILRQGQITIPQIAGQTFISSSEAETQQIAQKILSSCLSFSSERSDSPVSGQRPLPEWHGANPCLLFALQGELGAGKTQFAKGLAAGLNIKTNITSPTFTIIKEYPYSRGIFYHLDTWRLEKGEELLDLGLLKMLKPGNVIAIEWLQKVKGILKRLSGNSPRTVARSKPTLKIIWVTIETLSPKKRRIKYQI